MGTFSRADFAGSQLNSEKFSIPFLSHRKKSFDGELLADSLSGLLRITLRFLMSDLRGLSKCESHIITSLFLDRVCVVCVCMCVRRSAYVIELIWCLDFIIEATV
jgi:hypothetical protein